MHARKPRITLKAIAQPKRIAAAVAWLATEEGWCYAVPTNDMDGGYIMDGSLLQASY